MKVILGYILRYRNFIFASVIILIFSIVISSTFSRYSSGSKDFKAKEKKLKETEKIVKKYEKLTADYTVLSKKFLEKDALFFKKLVEEKARASQVNIASLNINRVDKDFYWEAMMQLRLVCSYESFKSFIQSLEEKNIEITRMKIGRADEGVNVSVSLRGIVIK